jgi:hypothetical protein
MGKRLRGQYGDRRAEAIQVFRIGPMFAYPPSLLRKDRVSR